MASETRRTLVIDVEGMHCENCVRTVRTALQQAPGVEKVDVRLGDQQARVTFDPQAASGPALLRVIKAAGFGARGFRPA